MAIMSEGSTVRIGRVSSINYEKGMIRVTYPDRDDSVTAEIPVLAYTDEYKMPSVGSQVLVLHLSNGAAAGVCLGHYWNNNNTPAISGENVFRKELAQAPGEAYMEYQNGTLKIHADTIELDASELKLNGSSVKLDGEVKINNLNINTHTHTGYHGETSGPH